MKYSPLGSSGVSVSRVCLGSMTWGVQNNQQDADEQINYALDQGINFIDTAEMYAVPPRPETYGKTESIIGDWISRNQSRRSEFVLATKIAGIGIPWIRDGKPITGDAVVASVDNSLQRLQTDYIDVYQLHWPNRSTPHFGNHWPDKVEFSSTDTQQELDGKHDILRGLAECVAAGKVRHCGLSDDTPWGIGHYMRLAKEHNLPAMVSIQNEFSLLCTKDFPFVLEQCVRENIAYLPWSPLAGGSLSGKYLDGARPEGSRWTMGQRMGLFRNTSQADAAITAYKQLAEENGMTASQLALRWVDSVEGVTSTIIGATSMAQLKEDIAAFDMPFSDELAEQVNQTLKLHSFPF